MGFLWTFRLHNDECMKLPHEYGHYADGRVREPGAPAGAEAVARYFSPRALSAQSPNDQSYST